MSDGYLYLASPYSHPDAAVRELRYQQALKMTARLMQQGSGSVFCPIAYTHQIGIILGRPVDHGFWMRQDMPILECAREVVVLRLPGWMESVGIGEEVSACARFDIPVSYIDYPSELDREETILEEAQRLVYGTRNADYGHPADDYKRTAGMVSAMLEHKLKEPLTAGEMALVMCQVKMSRQINRPKRDNVTDLAGYAGCVHRIMRREAGLE